MYRIKEDSVYISNNMDRELAKDHYIMNDQAMHINADSMSMDALNKIVEMCANSYYYHEFKISGCIKNNRHSILKTVLDFVNPISFTAVAFKAIGNTECSFLAKDCLEFMMKIIANKFRVPLPDDSGTLMFDIKANFISSVYVKIDQVKDLSSNLIRRFDNSSTLNLNNFCEDENLLLYCPLYDSRTMLQVMSFAASYSPTKLLLQNNCLKDANSIYPLNKYDLVHLDLRNNQITSLEDLECLKHFVNLKHLLLDGNPICQVYNSYNYVLNIKGICKSLEKLDGVEVSSVPAFRKNFFCNEEGEDLGCQFLEHFFTVYDSNDRSELAHLYDRHAIASVGSKIIDGQVTSEAANLHIYGLHKPFIVTGRDVINLLEELPPTIHDPYTFVCDVTACNENYATISVNGIFRERNQILFFSRNFILLRRRDKFFIINDQLFVTNPTDIQIGWSFRFPKPNSFYPYFGDQYKEMVNVLRAITRMNSSFCRGLLDMCGYDLKISLEYFKEDLKIDDIPKEAFIPDSSTYNDSENNTYSSEIVKKTKEAFSTVNAKTVWETYNKQRLTQSLGTTRAHRDRTIDRIYTNIKPYSRLDKIVNKKKKNSLSEAFTAGGEKKSIQIHLTGSTKIPQTEQSKSATAKNNSTNRSPTKRDVVEIASTTTPQKEQSKPTNSKNISTSLSSTTRKTRRGRRGQGRQPKWSFNYDSQRKDRNSSSVKPDVEIKKGTNRPPTKRDVVETATTKTLQTEQSKPANSKIISTSLSSNKYKRQPKQRWGFLANQNPNVDSQSKDTNRPPTKRDVVETATTTTLQTEQSKPSNSKSKFTNSATAKRNIVDEIATKVARNLRLKQLKKQIEKENSLSIIGTESKNQQKQDSKQIEKEQNSSVTSNKSPAANTTVSNEKQDPSKSTVTSSTKPTSSPVVTTPLQPSVSNRGKPVPGKKMNRQPKLMTKAEAQALVNQMFPRLSVPPLQPQGLGILPQDLLSAQAQTMMSMQRQALPHPFLHPNWQALGIPEVIPNMMSLHENMLNVPNALTIPDNIVPVPEMLRMQAELFSNSPPIANEVHLPPFIFNLEDFEPPQFRPSKKIVEAKTVQQPPKRQALTPPPGVDMEEFLMERNADMGLKRKAEEQNVELSKKQKLPSNESAISNQNKSCTNSAASEHQAADANKGKKEVNSEQGNKKYSPIDLTKEDPPPLKSADHSEVDKVT